jgi:hypothetical protein
MIIGCLDTARDQLHERAAWEMKRRLRLAGLILKS